LHKGYGRPLAIRFQTVSDEILTLANWQIFLAVKNSLVGADFAKTPVKKLKLLNQTCPYIGQSQRIYSKKFFIDRHN
jgi:hypothetical protein